MNNKGKKENKDMVKLTIQEMQIVRAGRGLAIPEDIIIQPGPR